MARVDKKAAREELDKADHLKDKAEDLIEIADELKHEAQRHERNAEDLVAPTKPAAERPATEKRKPLAAS